MITYYQIHTRPSKVSAECVQALLFRLMTAQKSLEKIITKQNFTGVNQIKIIPVPVENLNFVFIEFD